MVWNPTQIKGKKWIKHLIKLNHSRSQNAPIIHTVETQLTATLLIQLLVITD